MRTLELVCLTLLLIGTIASLLWNNQQDRRLDALEVQVDSLKAQEDIALVIPADQVLARLDDLEARVEIYDLERLQRDLKLSNDILTLMTHDVTLIKRILALEAK